MLGVKGESILKHITVANQFTSRTLGLLKLDEMFSNNFSVPLELLVVISPPFDVIVELASVESIKDCTNLNNWEDEAW